MSEVRTGFFTQIKSYPAQFWVANTMEIFERMSWYGWFTVMALYVTGSVETGGLGFDTETRGALQAIVPFFLYMFPVLTGAIADRYGFKRVFIIAYALMIISYFLLGQFTSLPIFFVAFMFVAIGAALFKPVVVGTVAKVTDATNSATGFGIFYMMVNIGGFVGPIVAGVVRGEGWEWVFVACAFWAFVNLLIVLFFYKEPTAGTEDRKGSFKVVLDNMIEVLGNIRFFLTVFVILFALMFANLRVSIFSYFTWTHCAIFIPLWLILNIIWDRLLPKGSGVSEDKEGGKRSPLLQRMYCSNWRFALFLLIMSGFWTSFNQIFYTMPEYIRDFVDTRPAIELFEDIFGESDENDPNVGIASKIATVNEVEMADISKRLAELIETGVTQESLETTSAALIANKLRISPDELKSLIAKFGSDTEKLASQSVIQARQVNPEFVVNIDAGAIVLFQILISFLMARFHRFTTMIAGMFIAAIGIGLSAFAGGAGMLGAGASIWIVALGLFVFAIGEMMASPTSQEYVGRIAPEDKKALYMGYYFVAIALGNLFGGILSGELYGTFARDMQRPDLMWLIFGGIMILTAIVFILYNRFVLPKNASESLTG